MRYFHKGGLFFTLGILVLTVLLVAACGPSSPADISSVGDSATTSPVASGEVAQQSFVAVSFADDQLTPETIQVKQGDMVTLNLETDRPGTFHIHGYDLEKEATVGEVTDFQFEANATGRFRINFHGVVAPEDSETRSDDMSGMSGNPGSMEHGPMDSAEPVSVGVTATVTDGGVHVNISTEGWRWAPEEANGQNSEGAGHAHIYAGDVKLSRVYGPYHYLPGLAPGTHEIRISLNTNDHSELTWQGELLEATTSVSIPDEPAMGHDDQGHNLEPVVSETPMSLKIVLHEDSLGGYNLQVEPDGFDFSQSVGLPHAPGVGYAQLSINGDVFNRLYVPWLQVPSQGEGEHTFTVILLNNEGMPYYFDGQPVEASVQVQEEAKEGDDDGAAADHHDGGSSPKQEASGHHGSGPDPAAAAASGHDGSGTGEGATSDHHGGGTESAATDIVEFEVGYLEVLP